MMPENQKQRLGRHAANPVTASPITNKNLLVKTGSNIHSESGRNIKSKVA